MDVLVAETNLEFGWFGSLVAEAIGVDMATAQTRTTTFSAVLN